MPALETVSRNQAHARYAGLYEASEKNAPHLNSSLRLTTEQGLPGLGIDRWISNATDMMATLGATYGMRLYPTNLEEVHGHGSGTK